MKDLFNIIKKYPLRGAMILIALVCAILINLCPIIFADYSMTKLSSDSYVTTIEDERVPLSDILNYNGATETLEVEESSEAQ